MKIFLIRHAHALSGEPDELRPLSSKGKKQMVGLSPSLVKRIAREVSVLEHSSLQRSGQTAQLLKKHFRLKQPLQSLSGISPESSAVKTAQVLSRSRRSRCIIGHNPHLARLVGLLLGLKQGEGGIYFRKAAIVALERTAVPQTRHPWGSWRLLWMSVPD
jgi:phosphohistidine phosphatase